LNTEFILNNMIDIDKIFEDFDDEEYSEIFIEFPDVSSMVNAQQYVGSSVYIREKTEYVKEVPLMMVGNIIGIQNILNPHGIYLDYDCTDFHFFKVEFENKYKNSYRVRDLYLIN